MVGVVRLVAIVTMHVVRLLVWSVLRNHGGGGGSWSSLSSPLHARDPQSLGGELVGKVIWWSMVGTSRGLKLVVRAGAGLCDELGVVFGLRSKSCCVLLFGTPS